MLVASNVVFVVVICFLRPGVGAPHYSCFLLPLGCDVFLFLQPRLGVPWFGCVVPSLFCCPMVFGGCPLAVFRCPSVCGGVCVCVCVLKMQYGVQVFAYRQCGPIRLQRFEHTVPAHGAHTILTFLRDQLYKLSGCAAREGGGEIPKNSLARGRVRPEANMSQFLNNLLILSGCFLWGAGSPGKWRPGRRRKRVGL